MLLLSYCTFKCTVRYFAKKKGYGVKSKSVRSKDVRLTENTIYKEFPLS